MTSIAVYESIVALIDEHYPATQHPAENAYLHEVYAYQPDTTEHMQEAAFACFARMDRAARRNPQLDEAEAREIGFGDFIAELGQRLYERAQDTFAD